MQKVLPSKGVFFNLLNHNRNDWERQLRFIKALPKVDHIEIWLESLPLKNEDVIWLNTNLATYRHLVHAPFIETSFVSPNRHLRAAAYRTLKDTAALAKRLKAELITFHLGNYPFFHSVAAVTTTLKKELFPLISEIKPQLAIENLPPGHSVRLSAFNTTTLAKIFPTIPLTLDTGHAWRQIENPTRIFNQHHHQIKNIHLVDGTRAGGDHLEFGLGEINLEQLVNAVKAKTYTGFLTVEVLGEKAIQNSWKKLLSWLLKQS
ncbi:MAG: sugar phosphate isomerase/epimerase [Candidatus Chisholmbacteria bacterium]|nr:sugar phosphate isomerase/epimerase [Candidatus Chisholmbacteria bacterium]